jgi:hypothetical protein
MHARVVYFISFSLLFCLILGLDEDVLAVFCQGLLPLAIDSTL